MIETINEALGNLKDKLLEWINEFVLILPELLIAIVIVIVGWFVAKYVFSLLHRGIMRASGSNNVADLVASIARVIVIWLALFLALGVIGLSSVVAGAFAGAGIVGLAVGFALQDPLANLFSGVLMSVKELYAQGDLVETNDYMGVIQGITLRTTLIRTLTGQEVAIPNKDVLQKPLTNYTRTHLRRVDLPVGISYGDDLERAAGIARRAVEGAVEVVDGREVEVFWTEFGSSSINGTVRFWLSDTGQKDFLDRRSRAIVAIKAAFDEHDVMIPFPIRTLDFGIRGGEKLSEMEVHLRRLADGGE